MIRPDIHPGAEPLDRNVEAVRRPSLGERFAESDRAWAGPPALCAGVGGLGAAGRSETSGPERTVWPMSMIGPWVGRAPKL